MHGNDDDDADDKKPGQVSLLAHEQAGLYRQHLGGNLGAGRARASRRKPKDNTVGALERGTLIDVDGEPYRIAFHLGGYAYTYPARDVCLRPDCGNLLRVPETAPAVLYRPGVDPAS